MRVDDITELKIISVLDRGTPNKERIVITIEETVNMGQYGLMLGIRSEENAAVPIRDNMLWFGDGIINKGDWLFVYTGPGKAVSSTSFQENNLVSVHWQREKTVFASPDIIPILFRVDAVSIPSTPVDVPQLASLK